MSKIKLNQLSTLLLFLFFCSCDPGQEMIRYDELEEVTDLYQSGLTGSMNERIDVIVK